MNRNNIILNFTFIFISILSQKLSAQIDTRHICYDFHKNYCSFEERLRNFDYNIQSKSTLFKRGETSETYFIAYKGFDYRLSFCAQEDLIEDQKVAFFIRNAKTKELIFENSTEEFTNEFEFTCTGSTRILVEISLPPESVNKLKPGNRFEYKGCVGMLIESRPSPKVGFKQK